MVEIAIDLDTVEDVEEFVSIAETYDFNIDMKNWHQRVVDAKSVLGVMSLDLSKSLTLLINYEPGDYVNSFLLKIKRFLTEAKS